MAEPLSALRDRYAQPDAAAAQFQALLDQLAQRKAQQTQADADQAAMMSETFVPPGLKAFTEQAAPKDYAILHDILQGTAEVPKRAIGAATDYTNTGVYNPAPIVDAAMLSMGGGAAGTGEGGAVFGAGPAKRAALDLSTDARMARAAEQGFDTSTPLYHGTSKDAAFAKFKDSRHGTWTTTDPAEASGYAMQNDSKNWRLDPTQKDPWAMKAVNSADRVIPLYAKPLENPASVSSYPESLQGVDNYQRAQREWFDQLKAQGHDGLLMGNTRVDFDNSKLRSTLAPFDPAKADKSVIFGAGPTDEKAAAAAAAPLFDYSRLNEVPNVSQFDLPRYDPPRGVSARVQDLVKNDDVASKMLEIMRRGKEIGGDTFYGTEPLRNSFIEELGRNKGPDRFGRYMDYASGTSPRSKVPENARNASYYYVLDAQGKPMPKIGDPNPQPYGHLAQRLHQQNARTIAAAEPGDPFGGYDIFQNPKPPSFSQNLQGNLRPVTVDAHAFKLPAMLSEDPRFLLGSFKPGKDAPTINPSKMFKSGKLDMEQALQEPTYWAARPNDNEYLAMENYYKRLSREAGFPEPGIAQAAGWSGGGHMTGLGSPAGDPFIRAVENRAIITGKHYGVSPQEALSRMIRGHTPLL